MARIELRLYEYFVALCEERHFARAAERLQITPPTLTHQIQKLEKIVGVRLVRRRPKSLIELTPTGAEFFRNAQAVVQRANEAELTALQSARGEIGKIEIGYMVIVPLSGLIQKYVGAFRRANPSIDITLHHLSTMKQIEAVMANKLDVGFARAPEQYPFGVAGFSIHRQPLVLAVPADHPIACSKHPIDLRTLQNETFVGTSVEFELVFQRHVESIPEMAGFQPKVVKRAADIVTILGYVAAGYGIAVVSEDMNRCAFTNVVFKQMTLESKVEGNIAFIYRTAESSPVVRAFIDAMRPHSLKEQDRHPLRVTPLKLKKTA